MTTWDSENKGKLNKDQAVQKKEKVKEKERMKESKAKRKQLWGCNKKTK